MVSDRVGQTGLDGQPPDTPLAPTRSELLTNLRSTSLANLLRSLANLLRSLLRRQTYCSCGMNWVWPCQFRASTEVCISRSRLVPVYVAPSQVRSKFVSACAFPGMRLSVAQGLSTIDPASQSDFRRALACRLELRLKRLFANLCLHHGTFAVAGSAPRPSSLGSFLLIFCNRAKRLAAHSPCTR